MPLWVIVIEHVMSKEWSTSTCSNVHRWSTHYKRPLKECLHKALQCTHTNCMYSQSTNISFGRGCQVWWIVCQAAVALEQKTSKACDAPKDQSVMARGADKTAGLSSARQTRAGKFDFFSMYMMSGMVVIPISAHGHSSLWPYEHECWHSALHNLSTVA